MTVWALVPVKCFHRGKSRLGTVLDRDARLRLSRALFDRVLAVLGACAAVDGVLVATDCAEVAAWARRRGACASTTTAAMPDAVEAGLQALTRARVGGALVLMSDLPALVPADVTRVARLLERHERVVVADRHDEGTNALALRLPHRVRTTFGHADSLHRHVAAARAGGVDFVVHRHARFGLDVDLPRDLSLL
jgi:2-phospho-L-lactate/phosphoenolpyruvate guanylyltransferase